MAGRDRDPPEQARESHIGGISKYRLDDGTIVDLTGFVRCEHWASFDVRRDTVMTQTVDPFSVGQSQQIPGNVRIATAADTSLIRAGSHGLPQDYAALIFGWRATVVAPRRVTESDAMRSWLASCRTDFMYRSKRQFSSTLLDLVQPPRLSSPLLPVRLQENLSYGVEVKPQRCLPAQALAMTLRHAGVDLTVRVYLDGFWRTAWR